MGVVGARHTHPRLKGPNFPGQRLAFLLSDFPDVIAGFALAEAFFLPKRRGNRQESDGGSRSLVVPVMARPDA
jgi:hypothetical protein